jgi:hypothetical protein
MVGKKMQNARRGARDSAKGRLLLERAALSVVGDVGRTVPSDRLCAPFACESLERRMLLSISPVDAAHEIPFTRYQVV